MEQPLRTLFALDLWEGPNVRFRPWVFLAVFAVGFVFVLFESLLLDLGTGSLGVSPFPSVPLQWLAAGLIAALVSFKWERSDS